MRDFSGATGGGARLSRVEALKRAHREPGEASFFYNDHHFQYDAVKVLPGEYFVSTEDILITTVLGSCIAACIWDAKARAGGMNHFMLPERPRASRRWWALRRDRLQAEYSNARRRTPR